MAHLGDLTEDGAASSFGHGGQGVRHPRPARRRPTACWPATTTSAGHDDQRGTTPYLQTMGPQRFAKSHDVRRRRLHRLQHRAHLPGRRPRVAAAGAGLADCRPSGFAWANQFIKAAPDAAGHPHHARDRGSTYDDNVYPYQSGDPENNAALSAYGQTVWDEPDQRQRPDLPDPERALLAAGAHDHAERRRQRRPRAHHQLPEPVLRRRRHDPALPLRPGAQHDRRRDDRAVGPGPARRASATCWPRRRPG